MILNISEDDLIYLRGLKYEYNEIDESEGTRIVARVLLQIIEAIEKEQDEKELS